MFRRLLIATGVLALAVPTYAYAAPGDEDPTDRFAKAPSSGKIAADLRPTNPSRRSCSRR